MAAGAATGSVPIAGREAAWRESFTGRRSRGSQVYRLKRNKYLPGVAAILLVALV